MITSESGRVEEDREAAAGGDDGKEPAERILVQDEIWRQIRTPYNAASFLDLFLSLLLGEMGEGTSLLDLTVVTIDDEASSIFVWKFGNRNHLLHREALARGPRDKLLRNHLALTD